MFLLFLFVKCTKHIMNSDLHSNMFLLFQCSAAHTPVQLTNLHSNMFLLFPDCKGCKMNMLCRFTFQYVSIISEEQTEEEHQENHLHSNMFLLFRKRLLHHSRKMQIYIPICFYYFKSGANFVAEGNKFTFQYVSIISKVAIWDRIKLQLFTFQYVSIISASLKVYHV